MNRRSARRLLREYAGSLHRELRIALTPVPRPEKWGFIVGCYNSGTTLLAELLGRHPSISALPTEGHFITDQLVKDYSIGLPRMWVEREDLFRMDETSDGPDVRRIKKEWGMRLDTRKPVLLEKSPPNGARSRWLQAHFQPAYFVALVRNGYAVAAGIRKKARPPEHVGPKWPIDMAAHQWARSNEVLVEDSRHLRFVHWVRYEELTTDPEATLRGILDFFELPWSPSVLGDAALAVHERTGPLRDLNAESLGHLDPDDVRVVSHVAGPMLRHFGYPVITDPETALGDGGD